MIRLAVAAFVFLAFVSAQNENMDMMGIINVLYLRADTDLDGKITKAEMGQIYDTMDVDDNNQISKAEFTQIWKMVTGFNDEVVEAYFFLADLDGNGVLDSSDNDNIYSRFDLDNDGVVEAQEFMTKYKEIYYEVPFVVIFERAEKANNNNQHLDKAEFETIFSPMSTSADGSVQKADFVKSWIDNNFGSQKDAETIFADIDTNADDIITKAEVGAIFDSLDTDGNGTIEILEAIKIANSLFV